MCLHWAVLRENTEHLHDIMTLLLEHGANIDSSSKHVSLFPYKTRYFSKRIQIANVYMIISNVPPFLSCLYRSTLM